MGEEFKRQMMKRFPDFAEKERIKEEDEKLARTLQEEEERNRTVQASSRKRVDIIFPLKWKSIVLVFNKFGCVMSIFRCDSTLLQCKTLSLTN